MTTPQLTTRDKPVPFGPIIRKLMAPPYGLSTSLVELLIAAALRTVKDQVAIFSNVGPARRGDPRRRDIVADNIPTFVTDADDHLSYFYEIDPQQRQYIEELTTLLGASKNETPTGGPWDRGKDAILRWHRGLPAAARDSVDMSQAARELGQWLSSSKLPEAKQMLAADLPQLLGISTGDRWTLETNRQILDGLRIIVEELQDTAPRRMRLAQEKLCQVFEATGSTMGDLDKAARAWYSGQSALRRAHGYTGETKPLMEAVDQVGDPKARLLVALPMALMQSCADTWTSNDQVDFFVERVLRLKQVVESWTPPPSPDMGFTSKTLVDEPERTPASHDDSPQPSEISPGLQKVQDPLKVAQDKLRVTLHDLGLTHAQQRRVLESLLEELRR